MLLKHMSQSHRRLTALCVGVIWLAGIIYAFWFFQLQYLGQFSERLVEFNGNENQNLYLQPDHATALVVHFLNPNCPCNSYSQKHIADLESKYSDNTEFVYWGSQTLSREQKQTLKRFKVPASPAVAIWNSQGQLTYFGPYSSGAFCGQGTDFVSISLDNLRNGNNSVWINNDVAGCFCDWPFNQADIRL